MKKKVIKLFVEREGSVIFSTPVGSPEVVVGLMSSLVVPDNKDLVLRIQLDEIIVPNEKEND